MTRPFSDTDSDDTASNIANFEGVVTSEVGLKSCLLVKLSEVAAYVAEPERLADPLPEKTRATAVLEFWKESVKIRASAQGINDKLTLRMRAPKQVVLVSPS